jgi:hypothetical protein
MSARACRDAERLSDDSRWFFMPQLRGLLVRGDGKPIAQQLLSDHAAPPYLWRAVAVHARQANRQHIQRRTADR